MDSNSFLKLIFWEIIDRNEFEKWKGLETISSQYCTLIWMWCLKFQSWRTLVPLLLALCWALKQHFCVRSSITTPTLFMPSNKGGAKLWFTKYVVLPISTYNMHCWLCLLLLLVAKWIDLGVVLYLRWQNFALVDLPLVDIVKGIPLLLYSGAHIS